MGRECFLGSLVTFQCRWRMDALHARAGLALTSEKMGEGGDGEAE